MSRRLLLCLVCCFPLATGCDAPSDESTDETPGLTNASASLEDVLERGTLAGACDSYWELEATGSATRRDLLLCGKEMFFYEDFETPGVPTALVDFFIANFPRTVGVGMKRFGMHADPYSSQAYPLGLAEALPTGDAGDVPTLQFTCASCHFGRAPDGRYVVGLGNGDYDYGAQLLTMVRFPPLNSTELDDESPAVQAVLRPIVEEWNELSSAQQRAALGKLLAGLGSGLSVDPASAMTNHQAEAHASWGPGRLDALMYPHEIDDFVHIPTKIPNAFGLPSHEEMARAGAVDGHLRIGWTGGTASIDDFGRGFIAVGLGDGDAWVPGRIAPLRAFLESLEPPASPTLSDDGAIERGRALFDSRECSSCHDGPGLGSTKVYALEDIGTDPEIAHMLDAAGTGIPVPNLTPSNPSTLTRSVKAPRLYGLWASSRFLHNGSVRSLEALFCLDQERSTQAPIPFSDRGHRETCDGLTPAEKLDLISYMRSL